jgi:hypothetical protein
MTLFVCLFPRVQERTMVDFIHADIDIDINIDIDKQHSHINGGD